LGNDMRIEIPEIAAESPCNRVVCNIGGRSLTYRFMRCFILKQLVFRNKLI
jgi:hypothetical protein